MLYDINNWQDWDIDWSSIDLVVGGFPCQAWSNAGLKQGDRDPRGMLFWTMLDVMKLVLEKNPKAKFLMENVRMKKEFEDYITFHTEEALGKVNKHLINSALVSAQNRKRFYWTNIDGIEQPEDQGLVLADILMDGHVDRDKSYCLDANYFKGGNPKSYFEKGRRQLVFNRPCELKDFDSKAECHHVATATDINGHDSIKRVVASNVAKVLDNPTYRKLRPCECEALQTFPIGYTEGISNSQRYKCLGNSFTVSVISHILSYAFRSNI